MKPIQSADLQYYRKLCACVANEFGSNLANVLNGDHHRSSTDARMAAVWLLREKLKWPLKRIAAVSCLAVTTVSSRAIQAADLAKTDRRFSKRLEACERAVEN